MVGMEYKGYSLDIHKDNPYWKLLFVDVVDVLINHIGIRQDVDFEVSKNAYGTTYFYANIDEDFFVRMPVGESFIYNRDKDKKVDICLLKWSYEYQAFVNRFAYLIVWTNTNVSESIIFADNVIKCDYRNHQVPIMTNEYFIIDSYIGKKHKF